MEKMDNGIHSWLGFWPDVWDRKVKNKEMEYWQESLLSDGSREGKEV